MRGRRRSTACSRIRSSSSSRSGRTRSPGEAADALDPRLSRNGHGPLARVRAERRGARGRRGARLRHLRERARAARRRRRRRPLRLAPVRRQRWCYALPELRPPAGRLIANPGCYATAALLALAPIAGRRRPGERRRRRQVRHLRRGRALKDRSHAAAVLENVTPYAVGAHKHAPEIAQLLGFPVTFVPHVVPLRRGLVCTCYVTASRGSAAAARGRLRRLARRRR